jgi:hypothetical protein
VRGEHEPDEVGADEAAAAGDEKFHGVLSVSGERVGKFFDGEIVPPVG